MRIIFPFQYCFCLGYDVHDSICFTKCFVYDVSGSNAHNPLAIWIIFLTNVSWVMVFKDQTEKKLGTQLWKGSNF